MRIGVRAQHGGRGGDHGRPGRCGIVREDVCSLARVGEPRQVHFLKKMDEATLRRDTTQSSGHDRWKDEAMNIRIFTRQEGISSSSAPLPEERMAIAALIRPAGASAAHRRPEPCLGTRRAPGGPARARERPSARRTGKVHRNHRSSCLPAGPLVRDDLFLRRTPEPGKEYQEAARQAIFYPLARLVRTGGSCSRTQ